MELRNFTVLSELEMKNLFRQLVTILIEIHALGVAHMDLKLENIMISKQSDKRLSVHLIDFGLSQIGKPSGSTKFSGSLEYACPEVLLRRKYSPFRADIYSLGIILYTLACGAFPYTQDDLVDFMHLTAPWPTMYFPDYVSSQAQDLISKITSFRAENRLSLEEILEHPFLN